MTVRILLADDHEVVRRGLRDLLNEHPGWVVCGEALTGRGAVTLATSLIPDIAILDLSMPELNGLEATRRIRKVSPTTEVLVYTMHSSERHVREVLEAGARGYVLKSDPVRIVEAAVTALSQHRPFFSSEIPIGALGEHLAKDLPDDDLRESSAHMTYREREVLQLLAEGKSNREVSAALSISVKTVETHRGAIMRKVGVRSLSELTRWAIRNGWVEA